MVFNMIEKFRNDPVLAYLLGKGLLTVVQLDTILAVRAGRKLRESVLLRSRARVSKGAFIRSLRQGERNVEASFYTLLLVRYLRLVDADKLSQFARIGELIDQVGPGELHGEGTRGLLEAMTEFIEGLSRNRNVIV